MILKARENRRQAAFYRAAALTGSTLNTIDAAITAANQAGATTVTINNPLQSDIDWLREHCSCEIRPVSGSTVTNGLYAQYVLDMSTPTDSGADY